MKLEDFDYNLPKELIAQAPKNPRDHSRLLLLDKKTSDIKHKHFYDIIDYFKKGDVLVMNNSKVFPARLIGKKKNTGGKIEIFLHKHIKDKFWQCLIGGRGVKIGLEIVFKEKLNCIIEKDNKDGTWDVSFNAKQKKIMKVLDEIGEVPLPPYIKSSFAKASEDRQNYQTVYADKNKVGSVAAPTAGFHFTPELIKKIEEKGVQIEQVTLHVGLGTFAPVKTNDITKHKMHREFVEIKKDVIERIEKAKKNGKKIIAVGTTSTRVLEALSSVIARRSDNDDVAIPSGLLRFARNDNNISGWVNIFIYPGYKFKIVDAMITNFHLPKSTLLMLISALAGKDSIDKAYQTAIEEKYRFYSYGDSMFIL